ncbi:Alpha/Beta hydrolase protein [Xylaria bambusicola]|uniref:Alpha/Beta hydrolase protein n=1 Tax=Xylaria bambusicola TaxID=326684 RepID=UPI0020079D32|nr:Alpha/Beta hydrolase protein [Xylaria bambusicola]KAI0528266.1 Alpha/Beta hydrolase protein [Xylaria bambusicola]
MSRIDAVSFPTLDGLTLRGNLYPASQRGPGIILLPGFSFVKEIMLPKVAESFQGSGITVLTYDPRTLGESDGSPRRDIDPAKHVSDLHDALTFLQKHPMVDPDKIAYWGFSFNGVVALNAAALDRRAKCVIAVSPLTDLSYPPEHLRVLLRDAMEDREAQLTGADPVYVPVIQKDGNCSYGWGPGTTVSEYQVAEKSASLFPTYKNEMTVQSHYRISTWRPYDLIPQVAPTPVMIVTPLKDRMSLPTRQKALFEKLSMPKEHLLVPNKGHMDIFTGKSFGTIMTQQVKFLRNHLEQQSSPKATL